MITKQDRMEFKGFCQQASDNQIREIYKKEMKVAKEQNNSDREVYAEIAEAELARRGLE